MSVLTDLLSVARSQIGIHEEPPGSNRTKYGAWYGMDGNAWCAMFVSWCANQAGATAIIPKHAYTPSGAQWFKDRGQWGSAPKIGAIVYYDIAGMGRISHVGIVETVLSDGSFYAIEGNTNGSGSRTGGEVWRQHRKNVGSRGGFGYPKYPTIQGGPSPTGPSPTGPGYPGHVLRRGEKSDAVRTMQERLKLHLVNGYGKTIDADGDFGPRTEDAVRWFQHARSLDIDGQVGPNTWRSLWQ